MRQGLQVSVPAPTPAKELALVDCSVFFDRVPGTDFVIPAGMLVQIPTLAIMKDPRHFGPDPDAFDPGHFADQSRRAARSPYSFLAFGQGPRNCVGMRFATLQMKAALVRALRRVEFAAGPRTPSALMPDPLSPSNQPVGGFWLRAVKRGGK